MMQPIIARCMGGPLDGQLIAVDPGDKLAGFRKARDYQTGEDFIYRLIEGHTTGPETHLYWLESVPRKPSVSPES